MKKLFINQKLLAIILAVLLVLGSGTMAFAALPEGDSGSMSGGGGSHTHQDSLMKEIVTTMAESIDGEDAFDYVSYVYMGWRTTGGPWQNQVIEHFLVDQLEEQGYVKADKDMSGASDQDYVWIQHDDSTSNVWAPEYARLKVVTEVTPGFEDQVETFNVESYAFDPTSKTYMDHYGAQYGISNINEMWDWITEKDSGGKRTNVINGLEAELNKRAHLTWQTGFTNPSGTEPKDAKATKAEVVNVGKVTSAGSGKYVSEYKGAESDLQGKLLLCTTGNSTNWNYAKQVGAVSVMSKASLSSYSNPVINGEQWYTDSARYASGRGMALNKEQMDAGTPIVEWNLSIDQEKAMLDLLAAHDKIEVEFVSIGDIYPMSGSGNESKHGDGQLMAIAEIAGSTKPEERVMFMAHVQEPSANDNATGVGLNLELALKMKEMIDTGKMKRPERTITFFWGDEMSCARLWLAAHEEEQKKVVCAIDLDMVGEDSEKTGGVMRIEKTPDPSAIYNYTLDVLPGQAPYHETSKDFVRLPDSHTLWGAGKVPQMGGFYLNDLYMEAAQQVISSVDGNFQVDVCPYEGGSDHSVFLQAGVPALLTWHFTDYVYHTTVDTLDKVSAKELENVGITSLATGYLASIATEKEAEEIMDILMIAAAERFRVEKQNTIRHQAWTVKNVDDKGEALALETEILNAWGTWYKEALQSCESYLLDNPSAEYGTLKEKNLEHISTMTEESIRFAQQIMGDGSREAIDINGDGILDWQDLSRALTYFGKTSEDDGWHGEYGFWRADLDKDGIITITDFVLLKHAIHTAEL